MRNNNQYDLEISMKCLSKMTCAVTLACWAVQVASASEALYTAYQVPSGTIGNQNLSGAPQSLGMDFDVNSAISVFALGVFDSGGNGFFSATAARIFDRDTKGTGTPNDDTSTLIGWALKTGLSVTGGVDQSGITLTLIDVGMLQTATVDFGSPPTVL